MIKFLLVFVLTTCSIFGNFVDHLRKIENKSSKHSMRNIDFIYLINLDQRPEKLEKCMQQLSPYGITPYRFSAVNGWELPIEVANDIGVKFQPWMKSGHMATTYLPNGNWEPHHEMIHVVGRTYFVHCLARGPIGILLSHLSIVKDAYDSGYETIWVMEDDIEVLKNPNLISDRIHELDKTVGPKGWDILFTDQDMKNKKGEYIRCKSAAWRPNFTPPNPLIFSLSRNMSRNFRKIGARYGAHSMIIRRSGMKKLLDFFKKYDLYLPYDMDFVYPENIQLYTVIEDIVSNLANSISDNGGAFYKNKK